MAQELRPASGMRTVMYLILAAVLAASAPGRALAASCKKNPDCQDGDPCTIDRCDHSSKTCRHAPAANGTTCSDQNACTRTDTCQAGVCVGANSVVCTATDTCHVAGTCDPASGACSDVAAPDDTPCTDYDSCTQTDVCQAGQCVGGNPVTCTAIDDCHLAGTCEPTTGFCPNPPKDIAVCAAIGQCDLPGTCNPVTNACTTSTKADGSQCNDGDACTQTDACSAGSCVGGNPTVCGSAGACTVGGTCDSLTGLCSSSQAADGTACNAGAATLCSAPDTCQGGVCVPGGGGDQDEDGICDGDDDCAGAPDPDQRDLDGDGSGDVCDATDASIDLERAVAHTATPPTASNGHFIVRGKLTAAPADAFGVTDGLGVHVGDAGTLALDETFDANECKGGRGGVRCKKSTDPSTQAKFRGHNGAFRFAVRLGHRTIDAAPVAPVAVTLTTDGMVDRIGSLASCKTSGGGAHCAADVAR